MGSLSLRRTRGKEGFWEKGGIVRESHFQLAGVLFYRFAGERTSLLMNQICCFL